MPAYNAENFIGEAIPSILEQEHLDWELLILNDASSDNTRSVIESFDDMRIKHLTNERNRGYPKSCNRLFELAKGDFITFLDADDTCTPNRLQVCLEHFENDSELGFLTTNHFRFDQSHMIPKNTSVDYNRYASDPKYNPTICCATTFVRTELAKKAGGYDHFFDGLGGEDYHWLYKLSRLGKGKHITEPLYSYRQHPLQLHIQNTNPLKFFVPDILEQIRTAEQSGTDLMTNRNSLLQEWQNKLDSEPALTYLRQAAEAINRKNSSNFWTFWGKSISSKPHSSGKWKQALYLLYSYAARIA